LSIAVFEELHQQYQAGIENNVKKRDKGTAFMAIPLSCHMLRLKITG